jgi:outer membrane immunogenic protein
MFKQAGIAVAILLLFTSAALAQEDGHFDFSISGAGVLSKQSSGRGTELNPTNSGGPLITFRYRLNAKHSLAANYSITHNAQIFTLGADAYRIQSSVSEYSLAYMFNPIKVGKFEPFLLVGAGSLNFNPGDTLINDFPAPIASLKQDHLAILYGGGVDYRVISHLAVRLQYRGLIYKAPDFKNPTLFTGAYGQMAEPSIGIVFRF